MNDGSADLCASHNCKKALVYAPQLDQLRGLQRNSSTSALSKRLAQMVQLSESESSPASVSSGEVA